MKEKNIYRKELAELPTEIKGIKQKSRLECSKWLQSLLLIPQQ
jgi:hypothetical protein